jgi:hypothetical protein
MLNNRASNEVLKKSSNRQAENHNQNRRIAGEIYWNNDSELAGNFIFDTDE